MSAMAHQVSIKWFEHAGPERAPLWLIAEIEQKCCNCAEPDEQCERADRCSQREHCPVVTRFAALHRSQDLAYDAAEHVVAGHIAVIRTDAFVTSEIRQ